MPRPTTYRSRVKYDSDDELKRLYNRLNNLWFGGHLPNDIAIRWKRLGNCMGQFVDPDARGKPGRIELDHSIKGLPRVIEWVLLHEMAHVKVGFGEHAHHGPLWQREIKRLVRKGAYDSLF